MSGPWEDYGQHDGPWNDYRSKQAAPKPRATAPDNTPVGLGFRVRDLQSIGRGAQETWDNAAKGLEHLTNWASGSNFQSADRAKAANQASNKAAGHIDPLGRFIGNAGAGALITAPVSAIRAPAAALQYAPRLAAAGARAVQGALANTAISDPDQGAGHNALLGAGLNVVLPPAIGGAAGWLANTRVGKAAINKGAQLLGLPFENTVPAAVPTVRSRALKIVGKAMADDNVTPAAARDTMVAARAAGYPAMLADQGENTARLAGAVARHPGPARTTMTTALRERMAGQNDRVVGAIERDLGPTTNAIETSEALIKKARADSRPLYDAAYAGGSIAPLEHQFQQAFGESSKQVSDAAKALATAQRRATQAAARGPAAGNVYAASAANRGGREAAAGVEAAQQKLAAAQAAHQSNLARLQQAQADGSANAPGAVWSPRIQQFLDDPIAKSGLAHGLEVQRLEALAEGKPFNPTEYAITGMDEAGSPIVGAVPNMRTLNAVKVGLDETIDAYPKDLGGRPILDQRGRAVDQVRRSFLKTLDAINPDYAAARAAYAGPASEREALQLGKGMVGKPAQQVARAMRDLSPTQRQQFILGHRSGMAEQIGKMVDRADRPNALTGSPERRAALQTVYGDNPRLPNFLDTLGHEGKGIKTHNIALTGSPTAVNLGDDALASNQGILGHVAGDVLSMAQGGAPTNLIKRGWQALSDRYQFGGGNTGEETRQGIAALLANQRPEALANEQSSVAAIEAARRAALSRAIKGGQNLASQYPGILPLLIGR